MAYVTEELERDALELIKKRNLSFIEHIVAFLPCDKSTFYDHKLHESDAIKEALEYQKISKKDQLQQKWMESENATTQIALYKLLSNDSEFGKLTGTQVDHTTKGESISISVIRDDG